MLPVSFALVLVQEFPFRLPLQCPNTRPPATTVHAQSSVANPFVFPQDEKSKLQLGLKATGNFPCPWGFDSILLQRPLSGWPTQLISEAWIYCEPLLGLCDDRGREGIFISATNTCSSSL